MEDNEFIGKLILLGKPELIYTKEDIENVRIGLIELKRSPILAIELREAIDAAVMFINQFCHLDTSEQGLILQLIENAVKRRK